MRTRGAGSPASPAAILAVVATPSIFGIRRSMRMTSGRIADAARAADALHGRSDGWGLQWPGAKEWLRCDDRAAHTGVFAGDIDVGRSGNDVEISGLVLWRIWIKSSGVRGAIDTLSVLGQLEALPR